MISGKPVTSEIPVMGSPASFRNLAVPPVEITSIPMSVRPRTKGSRSFLSDTETSARATFTVSSLYRLPVSIPALSLVISYSVYLHDPASRKRWL